MTKKEILIYARRNAAIGQAVRLIGKDLELNEIAKALISAAMFVDTAENALELSLRAHNATAYHIDCTIEIAELRVCNMTDSLVAKLRAERN